MTSRERLYSILKGKAADRPGLNFYEVGGFEVDPLDPDPFNVYSSRSWGELRELAENHSDLIRMRSPNLVGRSELYDEFYRIESWTENRAGEERRFERTRLSVGGRELTSLSRRDRDVDTLWTIEPLLKNKDDLKSFLTLPDELFEAVYDCSNLFKAEEEVGDRGIVMVDTEDPLCAAASLFEFGEYTILAMTEPELFHRLLEKLATALYRKTENVSAAFPGRLWRIFGPEYATEPYLPSSLFQEYVTRYTGPMVKEIQKNGGMVRLHSHGRVKNVMEIIAGMAVDAIDPLEPPPQGDVELEWVVERYGDTLTLFGNLEISDIEILEPSVFEKRAAASLEAGMKAKGFVLMPSASPYGREVSDRCLKNYRTLVRLISS